MALGVLPRLPEAELIRAYAGGDQLMGGLTDAREERVRFTEAITHLGYLRAGLVACPGILGRGCMVLLPIGGPAFMCRYHAAKRRRQLEAGDVTAAVQIHNDEATSHRQWRRAR